MAGELYRACTTGDLARVDAILRQAEEKAEADEADRLRQLRGYLRSNADGLRDYRLVTGYQDGLRGLGTIESNVDKLVANRMKKRGMSWSKTGANRMARLLALKDQGQLHSWVNHRGRQPRPRPRLSLSLPGETRTTEIGAWLEAALPAISGPQSNRSWVQILKDMTRQAGKSLKHGKQDSAD